MAAIKLRDSGFTQVGDAMLDARKRLRLGPAIEVLEQLFGDVPAQKLHFRILCNKAGQILLTPETTMPLREAWLHKNPAALKSVLTGLEQAAAGELVDRGSFEEFADVELDDDD